MSNMRTRVSKVGLSFSFTVVLCVQSVLCDEFSPYCRMHNEVNSRLNKPLFDCSRVDERWLNVSRIVCAVLTATVY